MNNVGDLVHLDGLQQPRHVHDVAERDVDVVDDVGDEGIVAMARVDDRPMALAHEHARRLGADHAHAAGDEHPHALSQIKLLLMLKGASQSVGGPSIACTHSHPQRLEVTVLRRSAG